MRRIRVEPISSYVERRRKGPFYPAVVSNGLVFLSGLPPFDPEMGDVKSVPFERQVEIVLDQMKVCLEAAGSSLAKVIKCNVYCTPNPSHYERVNTVYFRYLPMTIPRGSSCMCRTLRVLSASKWNVSRRFERAARPRLSYVKCQARCAAHPDIDRRVMETRDLRPFAPTCVL
jgi:2-iminobutanoate/2-iminopropanoate deaminase